MGSSRIVKRIVVVVVLLLAFSSLAIFVNTLVGYMAIFMFLFAMLFSFLYLTILRRGISFEEGPAGKSCVRGEVMRLSLVVRNESYLPAVRVEALFYISDLMGGPGRTQIRNLTIPPRSSKRFDFGVRFNHIGTYEVGISETRVFDLIGLFGPVTENRHMQRVTVEPRIFDIAGLEVSDDAATESKKTVRSVINDGLDYAGVREYQWGDPIKTIHWKLSSRRLDGEYYTRLYETVTNPGIAVIVDLKAPDYDTEELMSVYDALIESAFSIERYAADNGMETEFLYVDETGEFQRETGPLQNCTSIMLAKMPKIQVGDGAATLDLLKQESGSIYAQSNLVVCTANIDSVLAESALAVKASKRNPLIFAVTPPRMDEKELSEKLKPLRRLNSSGIYYASISEASQLEEVE